MKNFFKHWKTSLGGILYAAGYLPMIPAGIKELLQGVGVLLLGGSAVDADQTKETVTNGLK